MNELEQRAKMLQGQAERIYEHPDDHDTDTYCLARDVDTFVEDIQPVIERARRAEELERENEDLLRDWRAQDTTLRDMNVENERLFRALKACRAEMEHEGMDTSTPVRELHRGGRLEDA